MSTRHKEKCLNLIDVIVFFCSLYQRISVKGVCEQSILVVRIATFGLLRQPIRMLLFLMDQFAKCNVKYFCIYMFHFFCLFASRQQAQLWNILMMKNNSNKEHITMKHSNNNSSNSNNNNNNMYHKKLYYREKKACYGLEDQQNS